MCQLQATPRSISQEPSKDSTGDSLQVSDRELVTKQEKLGASPAAKTIAGCLHNEFERRGIYIPVSEFVPAASSLAAEAGKRIESGAKSGSTLPAIVSVLFTPSMQASVATNADGSFTVSLGKDKDGKDMSTTFKPEEVKSLLRSAPNGKRLSDALDTAEKISLAADLASKPAATASHYLLDHSGKEGSELGKYVGIVDNGKLSLNISRALGLKSLAGVEIKQCEVLGDGSFRLTVGDKHSPDGLHFSMVTGPGRTESQISFFKRF